MLPLDAPMAEAWDVDDEDVPAVGDAMVEGIQISLRAEKASVNRG